MSNLVDAIKKILDAHRGYRAADRLAADIEAALAEAEKPALIHGPPQIGDVVKLHTGSQFIVLGWSTANEYGRCYWGWDVRSHARTFFGSAEIERILSRPPLEVGDVLEREKEPLSRCYVRFTSGDDSPYNVHCHDLRTELSFWLSDRDRWHRIAPAPSQVKMMGEGVT